MGRLDRDVFVIGLDLYTLLPTGHNEIVVKDARNQTWTIADAEYFNFEPNVFEGRTNIYLKPDKFPHEVGSYDFNFELNELDGDEKLPFRIVLNITDSTPSRDDVEVTDDNVDNTPPPDPNNFNLKYYLEWTGNDLKHDSYMAEIEYKDFKGTPTLLNGYADIERPKVDDVTECIRGCTASVTIHANKNINIDDIYFEEEKTARLKLFRNGKLLFIGFVKPDGVWIDFVNEHYDIKLDAVDGLGTLNNLSFKDYKGENFIGKILQMDAVMAILKRTGLDLPINVLIHKYHNTQPNNSNPLDWTKINTEQFYKDDGTTEMDCEAVLKSILEPYNAIVFQDEAEWYVVSPIDFENDIKLLRYRDGEFYHTKNLNIYRKIGSHVDGFENFHINKNQQITFEGSIGAFRVHYKYGEVKSVLTNPKFSFKDGVIPGWILGSNTYKIENGIENRVGDTLMVRLDENIQINEGESLKIRFDFELLMYVWRFNFMLKVGNWYLSGDEWVQDANTRTEIRHSINAGPFKMGKGAGSQEINTNPVPASGELELIIYTKDNSAFEGNENGITRLHEVSITSGTKSIYKGENHTVQRINYDTTIIKSNKEVYNGDNESDLYLGTLYDLVGDPTTGWRTKKSLTQNEILMRMALDMVVLSSKPCKIFKGDVRGYLPYFMMYQVNNVEGNFFPIEYYFDTRNNIVSLTGRQFYQDDIENYEYHKTYDYGNAEKPTIK